MEELISNGQLNISSEEDVFTAVLNWVKHDLANRKECISKVNQFSQVIQSLIVVVLADGTRTPTVG